MFPTCTLLSNIVSQPFKRAQLGLFHGKTKQYGNSVPFSKHKTRRSWLPNVHNKRFFSDTLENFVRVKVSTKALKTIKKHGGIDHYVLKTKPELLGHEGMRIRIMVREKQAEKAANGEVSPANSSASTIVPPPSPSTSPSEASASLS
ncbi:hypothetical protein QCA50_016579 [Cerrena zonata]|uniref:Large ribosomal subunit protein bL28c n=1 Tax=Cerrena zonata TaxID=2478898 RepID=A0AAW0FLA5_9APHY